jgi:type IV secretion system protein VirB1
MSVIGVAAFLSFAGVCASQIAPETMLAIARVESQLSPLAIHDNTSGDSYRPQDRNEAIALAKALLAAGHSVDLGLMQVTSGNFNWLDLTLEDAFDPCQSMRAAARVLTSLSAYNTGLPRAGLANGYVRRVLNAHANRDSVPPARRSASAARPRAKEPDWDVFPDEAPPDKTPFPQTQTAKAAHD